MDVVKVGVAGFLMPLYSTLSTILVYALTQLMHVAGSLSAASAGFVSIAGVLFIAWSLCDDIQDFSTGFSKPGKAGVYVVGAIAGLVLFGGAIYSAPNIGADAVISCIISIVLITVGAVLSVYGSQGSYGGRYTISG